MGEQFVSTRAGGVGGCSLLWKAGRFWGWSGGKRLGENFFDDSPADIGEAKVAPRMAIGEEFVIDS